MRYGDESGVMGSCLSECVDEMEYWGDDGVTEGV